MNKLIIGLIVIGVLILGWILRVYLEWKTWKTSSRNLPKGFKKGICKCGNSYGYCGLDIGYCVKCIDKMESDAEDS